MDDQFFNATANNLYTQQPNAFYNSTNNYSSPASNYRFNLNRNSPNILLNNYASPNVNHDLNNLKQNTPILSPLLRNSQNASIITPSNPNKRIASDNLAPQAKRMVILIFLKCINVNTHYINVRVGKVFQLWW